MPAEDIPPLLAQLNDRCPSYRMYRDYYNGAHRLAFSTATFEEAFRSILSSNLSGTLRENLCPAVVAAPSERLTILGWDGTQSQEASDLWETQQMGARANRVHREAFRTGDAYILVWGDDPAPWPHRADMMTVRYSDEEFGVIDIAAKTWARGKQIRVNLYYWDRLERWISARGAGSSPRAGQWQPYEDDDGADVISHDFGRVPVEHFPAGAEMGDFGRSILSDVVPLQDALNKELANTIIASEAFALPLRALLGYSPPINSVTGKPQQIDFDPKRDQFLAFPGTTSLVQLPAADIAALHDSCDRYAMRIARVSGTPLRYFVQSTAGQQPSGESQRQGEVRLTSRVEEAQQDWTPKWRGVMELLGAAEVNPHWADASPVPESEELANGLALVEIGGSQRAALKRAGYDDDAIDVMQRERDAEQASLGQAAVSAFNAGQSPAQTLAGNRP